MTRLILFVLAVGCVTGALADTEIVEINALVEERKLERQAGFVPIWTTPRGDNVFFELGVEPTEAILVVSLAGGLGSNDVGLDRGLRAEPKFVRFERRGDRVLMMQPNLRFIADSDNPREVAAAEEAFAGAILAALPIVADTDDRVIVDATKFAVSDVFGSARLLGQRKQGEFAVDPERSVLTGKSAAFLDNTTIDAAITLTSRQPGRFVNDVAATPTDVTLVQRIDLIRPPEPGFRQRRFHPRAGFIPFTIADYAQLIDQPLQQRSIARHRLEKRFPERAVSEPVKPITYYLDPGVPEPIRTALLNGGAWWDEAFRAAGFANAFRIEMLPDGVDIRDTRYNLILWVHRATRGWSYGQPVRDPRTGEIIRGVVSLGSLRVRQDILILESLLGADNVDNLATKVALQRLEQLSAHEIGHTLGIVHNYAASDVGDRSVMDYPHPRVRLLDGRVDLADAYGTGVGSWDKLAIRYGYAEFDDEAAGLASVIDEMQNEGLIFISDVDQTGNGSASAFGHLWDNGADAVARFLELADLRRHALDNLARTVAFGEPQASIERHLVPVYLLQRYQLEAVAKLIAGQRYQYRLVGDELPQADWVPVAEQQRALSAMLDFLSPAHLGLPNALLREIDPPGFGFERDRETFAHTTGAVFDPLAPVRAAAQLAADNLLHPMRLNRLVSQHMQDPELPSLPEVLGEVRKAWLSPTPGSNRVHAIEQEFAWVVLNQLMRVYASGELGFVAKDHVRNALEDFSRVRLRGAFAKHAAAKVAGFLADPDPESIAPRIVIPPGAPI